MARIGVSWGEKTREGRVPIQYPEAIQYLHGLLRFGIRPGLARTAELLRRLGNPERAGARYIHVGGTNGKGSTAALIAAGLRAAGFRTGLYISPYLERWNERVQMDGPIADADVARLVARVRPQVAAMVAAGHEQPTEFEVTTALALLHFAEQGAEWAVLEVGLGGRYDATNVLERPALSCLTNVTLDHEEILGRTAAAIAWDKAGILKPGVPCVTTVDNPDALAVIREVARTVAAPLLQVHPPLLPRRADLTGQVFDLVGAWRDALPGVVERAVGEEAGEESGGGAPGQYPQLAVGLLGRHQLANAALAAAALELVGIPEAALRAGLRDATWPGRFEVVRREPLVVLDGAHNPAGAAALAETWRELAGVRRTVLLLGMLTDKDVDTMLAQLVPLADELVATTPPSARGMPAADLAERVAALGEPGVPTDGQVVGPRGGYAVTCPGRWPKIRAFDRWEEALEQALAATGSDDGLLIAGSLYLVGPCRSWLGTHPAQR